MALLIQKILYIHGKEKKKRKEITLDDDLERALDAGVHFDIGGH